MKFSGLLASSILALNSLTLAAPVPEDSADARLPIGGWIVIVLDEPTYDGHPGIEARSLPENSVRVRATPETVETLKKYRNESLKKRTKADEALYSAYIALLVNEDASLKQRDEADKILNLNYASVVEGEESK
ncbi:hypothetical protein EsH8_X_000400 [Colletotrichum jinshuiense]